MSAKSRCAGMAARLWRRGEDERSCARPGEGSGRDPSMPWKGSGQGGNGQANDAGGLLRWEGSAAVAQQGVEEPDMAHGSDVAGGAPVAVLQQLEAGRSGLELLQASQREAAVGGVVAAAGLPWHVRRRVRRFPTRSPPRWRLCATIVLAWRCHSGCRRIRSLGGADGESNPPEQ